MTAGPIMSPNRGQYIKQTEYQNQMSPTELFPTIQTDNTTSYQMQNDQDQFILDDRSSPNEHGGVTINPNKLRRLQ